MAVKIRLKRSGTKKRPFYHFSVTDSRSPRDSNFIEKIGTYDPRSGDGLGINLNKEKADEWLKKGVQVSERVKSLFCKVGLNIS